MRARLLLTAVLVATAMTSPVCAADLEGAAFVDTETPRNSVYVGEAVEVRLVVGYDEEAFAESVIQPFQRELGVPVHLEASWVEGLAQTRTLAPAEVGEGVTIALNDDVATVVRGRERRAFGRVFQTLIVRRRFVPTEAGQLVVPAPTLRFAYATTFREDFVVGRVPTDRHDLVIDGAPIVLDVRPLPGGERPEGFTGGVGAFEISAQADVTEVELDAQFPLRLRIEGDGNFEFDPPRLDLLTGFHVYGRVEATVDGGREVTYDVAVTSPDVTSVPAIPFAFFDPTLRPPGFRVAWTDEIPLSIAVPAGGRVRQRAGSDPPEASPEPFPHDLQDVEPEDGSLLLPVTVLLLVVIVGLLVVRSRKQATAELDPRDERVHTATAALDSFAGGDLADALAEVVAAHLRVPAASVVGPDVASRLERSGASPDLARRTAALLERLVAARYGGAQTNDADVSAARDLARELGATALSPTP